MGIGLLIILYCLELVDAICGAFTRQTVSERERTEASVHELLTAEVPSEGDLPTEVVL